MESLEHAMKRGAPIIAEYLGGAVNCDAYHMTDPRADGLGVSSCIERSLEDAGVSPEEVSFLLSMVMAALSHGVLVFAYSYMKLIGYRTLDPFNYILFHCYMKSSCCLLTICS